MYKTFFKRILDIILSLIALLLFLIPGIIMAAMIRLEDKGPIFYNAFRLGKNGKIFKMYKFRSMKVNSPDIRTADNSTFNSPDDPRLTKIGRFIRRTSIDELPQLINVLIGDMSLIGPRPDLPTAINKYTDETILKISVQPGITGYNQAYFRNSVSTAEKFRNDVYYVKNLNFIMDVKIFFKTIESILFRKNIFNKMGKK